MSADSRSRPISAPPPGARRGRCVSGICGRGRGDVGGTRPRGRSRPRRQFRRLPQDQGLQLAQFGAGIQTQFGVEMCRVTGVRLERLGSASGPVQRQHVQPARAGPATVRGPRSAAASASAPWHPADCASSAVTRFSRHSVRNSSTRTASAATQSWSARSSSSRPRDSARARVGGRLRPGPVAGGHRVPRLGAVCGEVDEVDRAAVGDRKVVTGSLPDDRRGHAPLGPQCLAQVGDIGLQAGGGAAGDVVAPHRVDQPVHRHHAAVGEQQRGQYGALLGRAQVYPAPVVRHLQGAQ